MLQLLKALIPPLGLRVVATREFSVPPLAADSPRGYDAESRTAVGVQASQPRGGVHAAKESKVATEARMRERDCSAAGATRVHADTLCLNLRSAVAI